MSRGTWDDDRRPTDVVGRQLIPEHLVGVYGKFLSHVTLYELL